MKSGRPNLDSSLISRELARRNCTWLDLDVQVSVGSTNDLAISKLSDDPLKVVIVTADEQTQGRGRLQREWSSPIGAGIALTIGCPIANFAMAPSTIPLVVGVAVIRALTESGINAKLKWPNDIVFITAGNEVAKAGGILLQRIADHVVIGVGINVDLKSEELPTTSATSLALQGYEVSREILIAAIVSNLENLSSDSSDVWRNEYVEHCATVGSRVRVTLADGSHFEGDATEISEVGGLVVEADDAALEVTVGDIEHLRHV